MRAWLGVTLGTAAIAAGGCASARPGTGISPGASRSSTVAASATPAASAGANAPDSATLPLHGRPQVIDPVAGGAGASAAGAAQAVGDASASAAHGAAAATGAPTSAASAGAAPRPTSDAEIRRELAQSGIAPSPDVATLAPGGLAISPVGAPASVEAVINAGNQIARLPYRFGGGHGTFEDTEYDCSGSLSFVLAAAGVLNTTMTSGDLMNWGAPGRGRWITIFANPGHTFMYVAGLRFDTVALAQTGSRWSDRPATERDGFAIRHPPGL